MFQAMGNTFVVGGFRHAHSARRRAGNPAFGTAAYSAELDMVSLGRRVLVQLALSMLLLRANSLAGWHSLPTETGQHCRRSAMVGWSDRDYEEELLRLMPLFVCIAWKRASRPSWVMPTSSSGNLSPEPFLHVFGITQTRRTIGEEGT